MALGCYGSHWRLYPDTVSCSVIFNFRHKIVGSWLNDLFASYLEMFFIRFKPVKCSYLQRHRQLCSLNPTLHDRSPCSFSNLPLACPARDLICSRLWFLQLYVGRRRYSQQKTASGCPGEGGGQETSQKTKAQQAFKKDFEQTNQYCNLQVCLDGDLVVNVQVGVT